MNPEQQYRDATIHTGDYLKTIAHSSALLDLSSLSLPEVDQLVDIIARVAPAGNVPGVVLNGLLRLPRRWPPLKDVRRDVRLLFQGVEQSLRDKAVYGTFFAGPAAVLWAYQNLLKLAGKDADAAFPEGTWQFYADYALRDDTARHTCETHGFDSILRQHKIELNQTDRMTAWVMAALHVLHQFDDLLANEWYERVATTTLQELTQDTPNAARFAGLYRAWEKQRPFTRTTDTDPRYNFPAFRRQQFDQFLALALVDLPADLRVQWEQQMRQKTENDLPRFQEQMSFLAYLEPDAYNEVRTPIPLENAHVGVIYQGRYYVIRACDPDSERPSRITTIRAQIARILLQPSRAPNVQLTQLAASQRTSLPGLRGKFRDSLNTELDQVHMAPIWLNFDQQNPDQPLAKIRQNERAIGDHPLTIFDTGSTFVFDVSHIFCDGAWSVALAEILTNEALGWANYLSQLPPAEPATQPAYSPLLQLSADEIRHIETAPRVTPEVSVETEAIDVQAILSLRKLFKQRNDLLQLTVNDLLLLYRAIHAASYQPHPALISQLRELMRHSETQTAVAAALAALEQNRNPAILIPVDASRRDPRQRVYPIQPLRVVAAHGEPPRIQPRRKREVIHTPANRPQTALVRARLQLLSQDVHTHFTLIARLELHE
jgi:hypothetical protein